MISQMIAMGRLTADPESKVTKNGKTMVSFSLAVEHQKDDTSFFNAVAFGKTAETITKYLKKGSLIIARGTIKNERWESTDGKKHTSAKLMVDAIDFVPGGKKDGDRVAEAFAGPEEEMPF